jgi:NTP pyrophosphatase (non-canonical NTP hydrolase)
MDKFTPDGQPNYKLEESMEQVSNQAQDRIDDEKDRANETVENTPKGPEDVLNDPRSTAAPKTKEKVAAKKADAERRQQVSRDGNKGPRKFEVDLDRYTKFVDGVTSKPSKNFRDLLIRYNELHDAGCDIARLDTAASGMSAEAGEFMEIVKKLKFQGKPYDAANKEHLTKELGDIMWYVAQACLALDMRLDEVLYINTLKLAARYPDGFFDANYSENRAPGDI